MAMVSIASNQLMLNYVLVALFGIGILFFFLKSFLPAWFDVRRSGGSKILVHIANPLADYFRSGRIDNGFLYYKARRRPDNPDANRMLWVGDIRGFSYKAFGVNCVDVDDITNCVWSRDGTSTTSDKGVSSNYRSVTTNNAEAYDEAQYTALHKPSTKKAMFDEYTWQLVVLGAFVIVVVGIVLDINQGKGIDRHLQIVYNQGAQIVSYLNVTG